jgi:hypothetical protein
MLKLDLDHKENSELINKYQRYLSVLNYYRILGNLLASLKYEKKKINKIRAFNIAARKLQ